MAIGFLDKNKRFVQLVSEVKACRKCYRMEGSERVLGYSSGSVDAPIVFIGEAPGRLGADASLIPFHGDQSGHNFESLLEQVGLSRYQSFITNAVLCNPRDELGNNSTPTKEEVANCSDFLRRQINLVQPDVVVTLGATALKATAILENHDLHLNNAVRSSRPWFGRTLIPLYHPGQRAMVHRSFANQLADYQFVVERLRRGGVKPRQYRSLLVSSKVAAVIDCITSLKPQLTYFALHKLFFLIEVAAHKRLGERITSSYIIRQKDGPYCVDLHVAKLKKGCPSLEVFLVRNKIFLGRRQPSLFGENIPKSKLTEKEVEVIVDTVNRFGGLSDAELKRRTYLTTEMRKILRLERSQKANMFNAPLLEP